MVNKDEYLQRIGSATSAPIASSEILHYLHVQHLRSIPYENFDIILDCPLSLTEHDLFDKIIYQRRGGFCYELNILFAHLLESIDFDVELLSANLWKDEKWGPEYDHLILAVKSKENSDVWLADVGNARWFQRPMQLFDGSSYRELGITYRLTFDNDMYFFTRQEPNGEEIMQYRFTLQPRRAKDFADMCLFKETSSDSWFRQNIVYSQRTDEGSIILTNTQCSIIANGNRQETAIHSFDDFTNVFYQHWHYYPPLGLANFFRSNEKERAL